MSKDYYEKNGAHYILSKLFIKRQISKKDLLVFDNCSNTY